MLHVKNKIFSKPFLKTLFWKQNLHHKHGVLVHTFRVVYHILKKRKFKMLLAGLLHDIGKPFVAYQKEEDIVLGEYSFTDHEEMSYLIIKDWKFVSDYTKKLVRYHYLIRDIENHKRKDPERSKQKREIWNTLSESMKCDISVLMRYDDLGKGMEKRKSILKKLKIEEIPMSEDELYKKINFIQRFKYKKYEALIPTRIEAKGRRNLIRNTDAYIDNRKFFFKESSVKIKKIKNIEKSDFLELSRALNYWECNGFVHGCLNESIVYTDDGFKIGKFDRTLFNKEGIEKDKQDFLDYILILRGKNKIVLQKDELIKLSYRDLLEKGLECGK